MANKLKIYKVNDFIRKTESGEIDYNKSIELVHELANAAKLYPEHNILVDMREATAERMKMSTLFQVTYEMTAYKTFFKNKIAALIPDDTERIENAQKFMACLSLAGFQYKFFISYEAAMEWLSDVSSQSEG